MWSDIQFAVKLVAQFTGNSSIAHLETAKRILYYLKDTVDLNFILERHREEAFDLVDWTDSNWTQNLDDRKLDFVHYSMSWITYRQWPQLFMQIIRNVLH